MTAPDVPTDPMPPAEPETGDPAAEGPPVVVPGRGWLRERGGWAAIVAGTALVIVAVVVLVLVVGGGGPPASAAELAGTAGRALQKAPAVRYTGSLRTATGLLDVDLFADRDGELVGTLAFPAGGTAKLLAVHGGIYLDGDRAWWLTVDPAKTGLLAGRWVTGGGTPFDFDPRALLKPSAVGALVRAGKKAGSGPPVTVRGAGARSVALPAGTLYTTGTGSPLGLDGPLTTAANPRWYFALDVAVLAGSGAVTKALAAAKDSARQAQPYTALPPRYRWVRSTSDTCDGSTCTEVAVVANDGGAQAVGTGLFLDRLTADTVEGPQLGTCETPVPPIPPGGTATVTCSVAASYQGQTWFEEATYSPGWQGEDPNVVLNLLKRGFDTDWLTSATAPVESLDVVNRIVTLPGWGRQAAEQTCNGLVDQGLVGPFDELAATGKFGFLPSELATAVGHHALSRAALDEAARLARAGSSSVAVGAWQGPSGTVYRADVIDLGDQRTEAVRVLDRGTAAATRDALLAVAKAVTPAPPGFTRAARLLLAPGDALYRLDRAQLRDALRHAGLTRAGLSGLDGFTLVTAAGDTSFTPKDFG